MPKIFEEVYRQSGIKEEYFYIKQVQYPTFKKILDYLESSNKIMYDKDGAIVWIFADNPKLKKLLRETTRLR